MHKPESVLENETYKIQYRPQSANKRKQKDRLGSCERSEKAEGKMIAVAVGALWIILKGLEKSLRKNWGHPGYSNVKISLKNI